MPRKKKSIYKHPEKVPYEEMKWCLNNGFKVCCGKYAEKIGRNYVERDSYRIEVYYKGEEKFSNYNYTSKDIQIEIANTYIKIYQRYNAKTKKK